jgi:hypothetical protein
MSNPYKENPHLKQWSEIHRNSSPPIVEGEVPINPNLKNPRLAYRGYKGVNFSVCAWGQRKLFLTTLDFLIDFADADDQVLYVGAAEGTNVVLLSKLIPDLTWHLYDPRQFDQHLFENPKVSVYRKFFGDLDAYQWQNQENILLLSDIRTTSNEIDPEDLHERKIYNDMINQQNWFNIIQPKKALFKFRLPYVNPDSQLLYGGRKTVRYLDGEIRVQPFAPKTSAESRLIPNGKMKEWDPKKYEDAMSSWNAYDRISYYEYEPKIKGLDHCGDCALEVQIWKRYLQKYDSKKDIQELVDQLNKTLGNGRESPLTRVSRFDEDE